MINLVQFGNSANAATSAAKAALAASAITSKAAILQMMLDMPAKADKKTIIGQAIDSITDVTIDNIYATTGYYPGLIAWDHRWDRVNSKANLDRLIGYWNSGSIISTHMHWDNPAGGYYNNMAAVNFTNMITEGHALNTSFKASLDILAADLQYLQYAGVPVLLRLFHEYNGDFFWWGTPNTTSTTFKAAWAYVHNYLAVTKGLTNLLWVFSPGSWIGYNSAYYPGDAYVDIVSVDYYSNYNNGAALPKSNGYDELVATGKPFMLGEWGETLGSTPTPMDISNLIANIKTNMPAIVAIVPWMQAWGLDEHTGAGTIFVDPWSVSRADLVGFDLW